MLADILHKVAQIAHEDSQRYHPRPSMASPEFPDSPGRCIRQMVYHRLGHPATPLPGRAIFVFEDGHWHEELSAEWIGKTALRLHARQLGVDIPLDQPIGSPYTCPVCERIIAPELLHGHIDGLLTDPLGVTRLWEHKAINHFAFQEVLDGELPLDYLAQGCVYLRGLQHTHPDIREALLLIKNKNTSAYLEYRFAYDPAADRCTMIELLGSNGTSSLLEETLDGMLTSALAKFAAVEAYAAQHMFPPRPYRKDHWRCSPLYCRWAGTCWEGYAGEVERRHPLMQLASEYGPILAQYEAAAKAKGEGEKICKKLRPQILAALEAYNTQTGAVDGLRASVTTQERDVLDAALLPPPVKKAATVRNIVEVLHVGPVK